MGAHDRVFEYTLPEQLPEIHIIGQRHLLYRGDIRLEFTGILTSLGDKYFQQRFQIPLLGLTPAVGDLPASVDAIGHYSHAVVFARRCAGLKDIQHLNDNFFLSCRDHDCCCLYSLKLFTTAAQTEVYCIPGYSADFQPF